MDEVLSVGGRYYILAESSVADERSYALKYGDTFGVFDRHGNIRPLGIENHGIYHEGTRFLSRYILRVEGKVPLLLNATVRQNNDFLIVNLTNPDFQTNTGRRIPRGSLFINRTIFLWRGTCCETVQVVNYFQSPLRIDLVYHFDADYRDIFEVRGIERLSRGRRIPPRVDASTATLGYVGLDELERRTRIHFDDEPAELSPDEAAFVIELDPLQEFKTNISIVCETGSDSESCIEICSRAQEGRLVETRERYTGVCTISTTNESFNEWLGRSRADLSMMVTNTEHGWYPYAGIPWFNTVFGRDGIITAMETLWFEPRIARGVLKYLAAFQADVSDFDRDSDPGKILHEQRRGEMAALNEIPFGNYYGTVDATPLFVILAGRYYERTGDLAFAGEIWPHVERALEWIDNHGDLNRDGFVEFERHNQNGLSQQGWKDSDDSCFHADGSDPEAPIALCEVQAYVYEAKSRAGQLAMALGKFQTAFALHDQAQSLQQRFEEVFWCEELGLYAMAIDGAGRPCRIATSNPGQCLLSGMVSAQRAARICGRLMQRDFFSGWGIRTLAAGQPRYNPMSYHNGSVWPHDNALIGAGMAKYGQKHRTMKILEGMFDASQHVGMYRLPELFCGFERRDGEGPTLYPVACLPQAWASASVFFLLQACLGLTIDAPDSRIIFERPVLPPFLSELTINNLTVESASVDLTITRHREDVGFTVSRKTEADLEVVVVK